MYRLHAIALWKAAAGPQTLASGITLESTESKSSSLAPFERHVFVCLNARPADAPRPSCTSEARATCTRAAAARPRSRAGREGAHQQVGCLDQCEHGPTVVVYPDASGTACAARGRRRDREEHLAAAPVERLRIADECLNAKSCPHKAGTRD